MTSHFKNVAAPLGVALALWVGCRHTDPPQANPTPSADPAPLLPPSTPPPVAPNSLVVPDTVAATGPSANFNVNNYLLAVALAPVAAPGDTAFTFELHGAPGYHVNEQYPISIELELANATASKTTLRRADAQEVSEAAARFSLPVHTTGPAATLRGTAHFAVCSAENCVPETRRFALVIP